jgi:hypothetical protein
MMGLLRLATAKMDCLPIVDVVGGYVNQDIAGYVQPSFGLVVTGSYTVVDWASVTLSSANANCQ